jgi:hypothetical protein
VQPRALTLSPDPDPVTDPAPEPEKVTPRKKKKIFNKTGYPSGNQHSGQSFYGGGGFSGEQRLGGGDRHDNRYDNRYDSGGNYDSGSYRQRRSDFYGPSLSHYYGPQGDFRGRRFQGRRPYGGGRGRYLSPAVPTRKRLSGWRWKQESDYEILIVFLLKNRVKKTIRIVHKKYPLK